MRGRKYGFVRRNPVSKETEGRLADVVYNDFSKAFDKVIIGKLAQKIKAHMDQR